MDNAHRHRHDPVADVGVLICTEPGRIERQSALLCQTIRLRGGRFAQVPIYSFQPRPGPPLATGTRQLFSDLDVIHLEGPFNTFLPNYGQANKAYVCAWAEAALTHDRLVWLDSDTLMFSEPSWFDLPSRAAVAASPEPFKIAGTTGNDENARMWDAYEQHIGLARPLPTVVTRIDQQRIRAYYNVGCVIAQRDSGVMRTWVEVMESLITSGLVPGDSRAMFTDQIAFSLALAKLGLDPDLLPPTYNYPIAWYGRLPAGIRVGSLDEIVIAHYFRSLDRPTTQNPLKLIEELPLSRRDEEIAALIRETGVTPDPRRAPMRAIRFVAYAGLAPVAKKLGMRRDRYLTLIRPHA
jgi:hypothetical protein